MNAIFTKKEGGLPTFPIEGLGLVDLDTGGSACISSLDALPHHIVNDPKNLMTNYEEIRDVSGKTAVSISKVRIFLTRGKNGHLKMVNCQN